MIKKIVNNKWFYLILIFISMLIFNILTPYIQDDFQLKYIFNRNSKINNLFDIILSLKLYYFEWGGRVLAHFFAYIFLLLPKWIFNIINSIIYSVNIYLIYLISRGNQKNNYKYILLIHMIVFIFFPTFAQSFLWLDGSCNYSITLCIQLFFIYKILNIKDSKFNYLIYIIISLLAGMCNENSSLSLIVFLLLYTIYDRSNIKIKIISALSLIIGYLFLFLAPGNYVRMRFYGGNVSFFYNLFEKTLFIISNFWPIILGIGLIVIVFLIKNKDKGKLTLLLYISALISFFSLMASPQLNVRSFTISSIYVFIIFMIITFNIDKIILKKLCIIFICITFLIIYIKTSIEYIDYYKFMNQRERLIISEKRKGKRSVKVEIYEQSNNCRIPTSCELEDINEKYDVMPNDYMSKYYNIKIYGYNKK